MNSKTKALLDKLNAAKALDLQYKTFKHYGGGVYIVDGFVIDTDDGEVRVLYSRVGGPDFDAAVEMEIQFVRPLAEFIGEVTLVEDDKSTTGPRFQRARRVESWVVDGEADID